MKDQRIPASSWKHRKHIFSLDEVEQGFFLDRFQLKNIGKTTIQPKLYCTTKGSLKFATIICLFLCLKFLRAKKPVFRAPQEHSRDSANESSCYHYPSERSQTKFEHQSATKFKICTRGSEVRNCRDQRVFFLPLVTIADSPLNCCHKQQVKKGRDGAVVLST